MGCTYAGCMGEVTFRKEQSAFFALDKVDALRLKDNLEDEY